MSIYVELPTTWYNAHDSAAHLVSHVQKNNNSVRRMLLYYIYIVITLCLHIIHFVTHEGVLKNDINSSVYRFNTRENNIRQTTIQVTWDLWKNKINLSICLINCNPLHVRVCIKKYYEYLYKQTNILLYVELPTTWYNTHDLVVLVDISRYSEVTTG